MKKLFIVLAVASLGFVACNNESKTDADAEATRIADSTRVADSLKKVAEDAAKMAMPDSTKMPDSAK